MDFFAIWMTKIYNVLVLIPKWLMFLLSGGVASLVLSLMHRPSKKTAVPKGVAKPALKSATTTPTSSNPTAIKNGKKAASGSQITPANTDSEQEILASPAKRTSARQRKIKK